MAVLNHPAPMVEIDLVGRPGIDMRVGIILAIDRADGVAAQARDGQRVVGRAAPEVDDELAVPCPQSPASVDDDLVREVPPIGDGDLMEAEQLHEIEEVRGFGLGILLEEGGGSRDPRSARRASARPIDRVELAVDQATMISFSD